MNKPLDFLVDDEISKAAFYQLLKESFYPLVLAASGERASAIRGDRVDRLVGAEEDRPVDRRIAARRIRPDVDQILVLPVNRHQLPRPRRQPLLLRRR